MNKHTPGPWKVEIKSIGKHPDKEVFVTANDPDLFSVCRIGFNGSPAVIEDAHLIAAAPEMLDALKAAREWMNRFGGDMPAYFGGEAELAEQLNVAIAKAEGKSHTAPELPPAA